MLLKQSWLIVFTALIALATAPGGCAAQDSDPDAPALGPPAGVYLFVPEASDRIEDAIGRAVAHMSFLIRGIARGRLRGANESIDRLEVRYPGETVWVSLRVDEPPITTPRDTTWVDYRRSNGDVLRVRTELSPGVIDQLFESEDGTKRMVYRARPDGLLALEVEVRSERLREPFTYTWVYRR